MGFTFEKVGEGVREGGKNILFTTTILKTDLFL